jgi:hypothetical protein
LADEEVSAAINRNAFHSVTTAAEGIEACAESGSAENAEKIAAPDRDGLHEISAG